MIIPCYKSDKNSIKATYHSIYATDIFLLLIFRICRIDHIMSGFKINGILFFVKKAHINAGFGIINILIILGI